MADNLDPEIVTQFQEAMRQATEAAKEMPLAMNATIEAINKATGSLKKNTQATDADTAAEEKAAATTKAKTALEEAEEEALKKILKAQQQQEAALNSAKFSLISFGDALLSGQKGFEKYNQSLRGAGDAAYDFGKSLGPLGAILGGIVKGATMVGSAMLKQADDTLKATDELSKMGTAGAFSAEQVRKMGTGLGLASDQLDKFTKPVKSLGSSLISLGGNAADGATAFQKLAADLQTSRQEYQRLGISQEELIQTTADFVNLQTQQGRQITEQMKRDGTLRAAAREYTDNLLELAALTGQDIDSIKKKNELAMSEIETAIQNNLLDQEINRLRKIDTQESRARAEQLEKERKSRDKLLQRVEAEVGDPALRKGLAKFLATGAITEEVAALKRIGVPVEDFAAKIKQGVDVSDEFMDSLSKNGDAMMKNIGTAALYDENTRKAFGVSAEYLNYLAKARDRDEKSQSELTKARIADTKAGKGAAGEDPAQKARNALTEAEIKAKVALDDLVASANPLLNNFENMSLVVKGLIIAAGLATIALGGLAAAAAVNAAKGALNTIRGAGSIGGPRVATAGDLGLPEATEKGKPGLPEATEKGKGGLLSKGGKLAGAAKGLGALGAVGMGAYQLFAGNKDIEEQEKRGEISAAVAKDKKQDNTYGAAGGTTGALIGGAVGSMLGPLGTVVGGYLGQMAGEKIGKWAASWDDDKNPELADANKAAEAADKKVQLERERIAEEQSASNQELSEAERKLAAIRLNAIKKQEAQLLYEESLRELKAATTKEEREAAIAKSDRAQKQLSELKTQDAVRKLESAANEEERAAAEKQLIEARRHSALIDEHRLTQNLKSAKNDEERKAIQEQIDQIKKNRDEELAAIRQTEEMKKAEEALKNAVGDEQKKIAQEKIDALKEAHKKELDEINKKYNTAEAKPASSATSTPSQGYGPPVFGSGLVTVQDVPVAKPAEYAGEYAEGGLIPNGKFGLVGERGPEFISGPAQITNQQQMLEQMMPKMSSLGRDEFSEATEEVIDTFYDTDKTVQEFDKELTSFVKDDPAGKMTKQLNIVTAALEDLNELMDPMGPGGLDALGPTAQPEVPSAQSIISAVLGGIAGMFGGRGRTPGSAPSGGSGSSGASSSSGSTSAGGAGSADVSAPGVSSGTSSVPTAMPSSGGAGDGASGGETQQGMEVRIGREIRKGGTVSWRTNNPGNISYGPLAQKYGAIGRWIKPDGDLQQRTTGIAIFPTIEHGDNLKMALWRRPLYIDRTIDEGVMKWTGTVPSGSGYAKDLARAANATLGTRIRDLSDQQLRSMTEKQKVWEGFKEGQISQAALGGIFSGPTTGYPVEMHGTELVTRLDPNSLLEKLAKTPAQQIEQQVTTPNSGTIFTKTDDTMKEVAAINAQMMEMLAEKLDTMINKLEVGNDTQDKLLKYSQV